jgi:two-component system chemotaxis sensor kinase CheA
MDEMDLSQFKEIFVSESKEHLVALNAALVELEKKPSNKEILNDIFRVAHTLKGMSATMGYEKITKLAHQMEDVLDRLRKGEAEARGNLVDVIFECFDELENLVGEVEAGVESKVDVEGLIVRLQGLLMKEEQKTQEQPQAAKQATDAETVTTPDVELKTPEEEVKSVDEIESTTGTTAAAKKIKTSIRINISHLDTMMNLV